jgi:RHS repeat-associated protein
MQRILLISLLVFSACVGYGQVSISGPTCVNPSTQYQYTISGNWNSGTNMSWCISGGTIVGFGTCRSGTPLPSVQVTWNTGITSGTVTLNSSIGNKTLTVSIVAALAGGTIATNKTQTINYNHIPAGITCSAASGGTCAPSYTYQWQQSTDNVNYTPISGASAVNLSFSTGLLQTTYYRRLVTETVSGSTAYSDVATVFVNPQLQGNVLGPAVQDLFPNSTPTGLGGPPAFGGGCGTSYTYQWQQSSDNVNFTSITGATATTYSPPVLTATTYYRRMVTCSSDQAFSSVATVNIHNHLAAGTMVSGSSFTITYNTSPGQITANPSTGGICGSYSYQWTSSPNNITFTAISGATGQNYTPGNLTSTIYLQRTTSCGTETVYTTTVTVTVMPQLTNGSITGNTGPITFNNSPGLLNIGTAVSGGNCSGTYAYQWQMSYDGVNFQNIPSATNSTFTPDGLQVNTYYRRQVVCGTESGFSNILNITINPQIFAGTITPAYLSIATNTSPGLLLTNAALGGSCSGSFSYLWQLSTDNIVWSDITGATSQNYTPGNLSVTSYYRRKVICGSDIVFTNVSTISVGTTANVVLNYVRSRDITKPLVTDPTAAANLTDPNDVKQVTQYIDGLSNIVQTVAQKASPAQKDMVKLNFLDNADREPIKYLPYTSTLSDGNYKNAPLTEQNSFNTAQFPGEQFYFSQTDFEQSVLNRTSTTYPQGSSWVGSNRGVSSQYLLNTIGDSVINWTIGSAQGSTPTILGNYAPGFLFKNITTDEQGIQSVIYSDLDGKTILKKNQLSNTPGSAHVGWTNTYYVYDDLNNLRFVITPRAMEYYLAGASLSSITNELCFRYEYDQRKRLSIKKVPGAGEVWMVYDARDRLVMTQDANLRAIGKWLVTEFDTENRSWRTGLLTDANNQSYHQNLAYNSINYPNTASNYEILTQSYYDGYSWVSGSGSTLGSSLDAVNIANSNYFITGYNVYPVYSQAISQNQQTRSLSTGGMVKVLGTTSQFLYSVNFYDDRNRIIQVQSINATGGKDEATSQFDFSGKILRNLDQHQKNGTNSQSHILLTKKNYDPNGRLLTIYKNIDNASVDQLISTNTYNEMGQNQKKQLGNNLDNLAYSYNIRGWLTGINKQFIAGTPGNYFGMELAYDKTASIAGTTSYTAALYNGNITGTVWKTAGDGVGRKYDFTYDNLNRLTAANFVQNTAGTVWDNGYINFSVSNLTYDVNGNILSLNQSGFKVGGSAPIDQLTYTYQASSNKLLAVNDFYNDPLSKLGDFHYSGSKLPTDYSYDANGNLILDNNKAISGITYNYLNLPQQVTITSKGTISYTYDAAGTKLYKTTVDNTGSAARTTITTYIGGFVYQSASPLAGGPVGADTLQLILHEEGRIRWAYHKYTNGFSAYGFEYDFFEKDHLGNTRVVLTQQKDTTGYLASGEAAYRATENQIFTNMTTTAVARISAPGYPNDVSVTNPNDTVFKVNGNPGGHKMGPSLLLKVMSGDKIDIAVQSFYNSGTTSAPNSSVTDVLASLATGIVNTAAGGKGSLTDLNNTTTSPIYAALNSFMSNDPNPTGKPKAYLNWILLDDQLKYVSSYPQSGAVVVGSSGVLNTLGYTGLPIIKNGYLYIWVSNETPNWDVFFDNLSVKYYTGPELEESHYYPFGLSMAAISSKALKPKYIQNNYKYNGKEFQNQEFSDGTGLEEYDFGARMQDPQIGRFLNLDPKADMCRKWSPYTYAADNPLRYIDPDGMLFDEANNKKATQLQREIANKQSSNNTTISDKNADIALRQGKLKDLRDQVNSGKLDKKTTNTVNKQIKSELNGIQSDSKKIDELNAQNGLLEVASSNINQLRNDQGHDYSFVSPASDDGSHHVIGIGRKVQIEGSNDGLYIHEISHISQSLNAGGLRFQNETNYLLNAGNGNGIIGNEVDAYRIQFSFNGSFGTSYAHSLSDINSQSVVDMRDTNGNTPYKN